MSHIKNTLQFGLGVCVIEKVAGGGAHVSRRSPSPIAEKPLFVRVSGGDVPTAVRSKNGLDPSFRSR